MKKILSKEEKEALLLLDMSPKVGAKTLLKVLHHYRSDVVRVLSDSQNNLSKLFIGAPLEGIIESRRLKLDKSKYAKYNIQPVFFGGNEYPKLLSEIYDPPIILYCRGNIDLLNSISIAIVGSRKYTSYSKSVLERVIPPLVSADITIISGLALGVDGLAHYITLENSGSTIGVLGCGVDEIYPTSNRQLGERILNNGGLIISEFPPGTPPLKQNFPLRNRIIAGMSSGTLVVEARHDSGSLITAGLANEYGREVFAVPGNIDSFASEGTNELIKQGAKMVTGPEDILSELDIAFAIGKTSIIAPENIEEEKIFKAIELEALEVDKISKLTKLDIVTVNSLMSIFEISGKVEKVRAGFRLRGKLKR
ncbi:MAG: DNA-processing protein DprA [Candidatus Berkelbacteria bacterium]|nr:DNA-processing protein DprA [Candidatus Berkelbacteria bacterium]